MSDIPTPQDDPATDANSTTPATSEMDSDTRATSDPGTDATSDTNAAPSAVLDAPTANAPEAESGDPEPPAPNHIPA